MNQKQSSFSSLITSLVSSDSFPLCFSHFLGNVQPNPPSLLFPIYYFLSFIISCLLLLHTIYLFPVSSLLFYIFLVSLSPFWVWCAAIMQVTYHRILIKNFYMSGIKCIWPNGMIDVMINLNSLKPKQTNTKTIWEKIITPNGKILIICCLHFQLSSMLFVIKYQIRH